MGMRTHKAELSAMSIAKINPSLLTIESELYEKKWWDYKVLHPAEATQEFANCYQKALTSAFKRRDEPTEHFRALKHDNIFENGNRVVTGAWKARQMADYFGIEYFFYCVEAMKYCEKRHWHYLPKTWQLYSTESKFASDNSMVCTIVENWEKNSNPLLRKPNNIFYKTKQYFGHIYQKKYQDILLSKIIKNNRKDAIISDLLEDDMLVPEILESRLGLESLPEAKSI